MYVCKYVCIYMYVCIYVYIYQLKYLYCYITSVARSIFPGLNQYVVL